jgi:transcriptional regulator with XRE-family HTH domain
VIRRLREEAGVSLGTLARRLKWDKGRLSKYENNHLALSLPTIDKIASALGIPPEVIVLECLMERYPGLKAPESELGQLLKRLTAGESGHGS